MRIRHHTALRTSIAPSSSSSSFSSSFLSCLDDSSSSRFLSFPPHFFPHFRHLSTLRFLSRPPSSRSNSLSFSFPSSSSHPVCSSSPFSLLSSCVSCSVSFSPPPPPFVFPSRSMANKEQKNRDKANMKKKLEKRAAAKTATSSGSASLPDFAVVRLDEMESKLDSLVARLKTELLSVRAGRAEPSQLDHLNVYLTSSQSTSSLRSLASISSRSAQTLAVQLYDDSALRDVAKALNEAKGLELSTQTDPETNTILVSFPKATKELRQELTKQLSKKAEETKTQLRAVRQATLHTLKGEKLTEEESTKVKARIQGLLDHSVAEVGETIKNKEAEINQV